MPDLWLPAGPDPLTTHRTESWHVDLLTADDVAIATLDGVTGGRIEQNVNAVISGGGTLDIVDVGQDVDWLAHRVQPWWTVEGYGSWPLGVYLFASPVASHDDTGRRWRVELLDKLAVLDQDHVDGSFSLPAGTVVTDAVRDVIASAGETATAITDSVETLAAGMVWPANTTKLRICNDLLAAINYFSVRCDGWGRYVAAPYVRPQDRPVAREFVAGARSIHLPDFTIDQDVVAIPNKVVVVSAAGPDEPALVGVATNTDPESPYSFQRRGDRWIVASEEGVEATSQTVVDAIAARRLVELSTVSATLEIEHAAVPLDLNAVVRFTSGGVDVRASVPRWGLDLAAGRLMRTTIREVAT